MHKKFEINWTEIKGGCQSGSKVVTHNSKSDLPLTHTPKFMYMYGPIQAILAIHNFKPSSLENVFFSDATLSAATSTFVGSVFEPYRHLRPKSHEL